MGNDEIAFVGAPREFDELPRRRRGALLQRMDTDAASYALRRCNAPFPIRSYIRESTLSLGGFCLQENQ
jgi:hypothetical protein